MFSDLDFYREPEFPSIVKGLFLSAEISKSAALLSSGSIVTVPFLLLILLLLLSLPSDIRNSLLLLSFVSLLYSISSYSVLFIYPLVASSSLSSIYAMSNSCYDFSENILSIYCSTSGDSRLIFEFQIAIQFIIIEYIFINFHFNFKITPSVKRMLLKFLSNFE